MVQMLVGDGYGRGYEEFFRTEKVIVGRELMPGSLKGALGREPRVAKDARLRGSYLETSVTESGDSHVLSSASHPFGDQACAF
jgi:hypothetical protein